MSKIQAYKLLPFTPDELWDKLEGNFVLVFDQEEIHTNHREVIYSSYVWEFLRRYPQTPFKISHHVSSVIRNGELGADSLIDLINRVFWDVYDTYFMQYEDKRVLLDELSLLVYQITNKLYNDLSVRLEPYVTSLDITDFIALTKDPVIEQAMLKAEPSEAGIVSVNELIQKQIKEAPEHRHNPLAIAIRTGIARMGQALQCLGPRGFVTDVDSHIFSEPIMTGYVHGIRSLYGSAIESRSASKALMNTTKPLQDSEYFSRRQQLVCMNVRNLHMCDCGSKHYLHWHVRGKRYEGTTKVSDGDLATIAGKYYLDEATNTLKVVKTTDTHLVGTTIKLRSITAGCQHPDPNGVCEVCFGELALALPINSNLGHSVCVTMTSVLAQLILSTKHYDSSSVVEGIVLKPIEKKYLTSEINGNSYYLSEKLKGKKVKLYILVDDAKGLPDLRLFEDTRIFNLERMSQFDTVMISVEDKNGVIETTSLSVMVNGRKSSLTTDMLTHIKATGYPIVKDARDGKYEFDMTNWDYSKPVFVLPMRHFNMSQHQSEIARMLEATAEEMEKRSNSVSPVAMLMEFHDLVNKRLNVNLSVLDAIIYSSMVVSVDEPNYDLPKPWTTSGLGVLRSLLGNRSLSAMMGYQGHRQTFTDPGSFVIKNRLDHSFDSIFMPLECLGNTPTAVK